VVTLPAFELFFEALMLPRGGKRTIIEEDLNRPGPLPEMAPVSLIASTRDSYLYALNLHCRLREKLNVLVRVPHPNIGPGGGMCLSSGQSVCSPA
jgi:hypothetical protein